MLVTDENDRDPESPVRNLRQRLVHKIRRRRPATGSRPTVTYRPQPLQRWDPRP